MYEPLSGWEKGVLQVLRCAWYSRLGGCSMFVLPSFPVNYSGLFYCFKLCLRHSWLTYWTAYVSTWIFKSVTSGVGCYYQVCLVFKYIHTECLWVVGIFLWCSENLLHSPPPYTTTDRKWDRRVTILRKRYTSLPRLILHLFQSAGRRPRATLNYYNYTVFF